MDCLVIKGGSPLKGEVKISGAKNAALTLMPAALLTDEPVTLTNVPRLSDIKTTNELLQSLGTKISTEDDGQSITLTTPVDYSTLGTYLSNKYQDLLLYGCLVNTYGYLKGPAMSMHCLSIGFLDLLRLSFWNEAFFIFPLTQTSQKKGFTSFAEMPGSRFLLAASFSRLIPI